MQKNYAVCDNFVLNLYIVYELNYWLRNASYNFCTKKLWYSQISKKHIKFPYNGWRLAFYGKGFWSFGKDFARNFVMFGVDNTSSSQTDNQKITF